MTEFSALPPLERINRYRNLAKDARREGNKSTGHLHEAYLLMADNWDNLADELALTLKPRPAP